MALWPAGEVTFLFTDLVGSTALWERFPEQMPRAYEIHDAALRSAAEAGGGVVYNPIGDAFQVAFADPVAAMVAARAAQRDLAGASWPTPGPLRVRMAVHRCPAEPADGDYRTPNLNRLGRLLAAAHGGQVLVSEAVAAARDGLPDDVRLLDLGSHRLRDLPGAERVWQLAGGGLEERFPPIETLERHPTNLAPAESSFVGREALVGEARRALLASGGRLVTLTGPGGTGKTRLATEIAAASLGDFPGGVWAVMLAGERDPGRVLPTIAAELGLREQAGETAAEAVAAHVAERRTLLLLDNLEQLAGVAVLVAGLLRRAPGLTVLATSRTPLRVRAEREVPVPPLPVPEPGDPAAAESDAVRLFAERMAEQEASRRERALDPSLEFGASPSLEAFLECVAERVALWDKVLDPTAMTTAVRLKAMAGLADAANTRKVKPAGDLEGIISLIQSPEAAIRLAAVKLAATPTWWSLPSAS